MALDTGLRDSLLCIVQDRTYRAPCPMDFGLFVTAQLLLAAITIFAVWLLAKRLSGSMLIAWLAAGFAILAKAPYVYANQFLTEALLLPLFSLFILFLVSAYQDRRPAWLLAAGVALALATLTRPGYVYLFYAMFLLLVVLALWQRRKPMVLSLVLFTIGFAAIATPWMLRNKLQLGTLALTSSYADAILAQRLAYNRMSWPEFGVAFVYWFPDFGDSVAKAVFPLPLYQKLGWGTGTYYQKDALDVMREARAATASREAVLPYLIRTEIVEHPVKHTLVSTALAWRAVFVSKYWGITGFFCFIAIIWLAARRGEYGLLLASLPVWFMVGFHAFATVSINRYNLPLIPIYAIAMAIAVDGIGRFLLTRWRQRGHVAG
jgi:4-amino-4-deoxy-L-arabinose transferase-like glycosyltransferase